MDIHGIPIQSLWTFVSWLPGIALRRFFPKSRLADLVYVDLRPRHDPATVNLGEISSFDIWLNIMNLSPFEVELDRGAFRFSYCGADVPVAILKRQLILPGETISLLLSNSIPTGMANQIGRSYQNNEAALDGNIEFNCKLHPFCKDLRYLSGIKPRVLNATYREIGATAT